MSLAAEVFRRRKKRDLVSKHCREAIASGQLKGCGRYLYNHRLLGSVIRWLCSPSGSFDSSGTASNRPLQYRIVFLACALSTQIIGIVATSPGARYSVQSMKHAK